MNLSNLQKLTKLPFHGVILPSIEISKEDKLNFGAKEDCSNYEFLTQLCRNGFTTKIKGRGIPKEKHKKYTDQVKLELNVIEELGFTNYILMVWDICNFADREKILRGPGRGSVGGSLVAYLIGITEIDPIENGLFFTRFLSKSRAKSTIIDGVKYIDGSLTPDVDLDLQYSRRQEIVDYINRRYPKRVSKTLTIATFSSKILIKDVMKTFGGYSEVDANHVSGMIESVHGTPESIEDMLSDNEEKQNSQFKEWAEKSALNQEICEICMNLTGLNRSEGQHASAVLVTNAPIDTLMPLQLSNTKEVVSGYDMYSAQEISIKNDILGLKALDSIGYACDLIGKKPEDIDVTDESIYRYLQDFKLRYGIFQLEAFAQGTAAARIKPRKFEQLAAVLAVARPGAMSQMDKLIDYVNEGKYTPIDPLVDDILKPNGGICLYQENLLAMVNRLGMSLEESEMLRRAIGKKNAEKVREYKDKIYAVADKNGHRKELADIIWKIAEDSSGYSFNASHSFCYATLTARTIYLKANYPLEFYVANLQMARNEPNSQEAIQIIESEMRERGYKLLPPHFIYSGLDFKIEGETGIRFGLSSIRGISDKNMENLKKFIGGMKENMDKFSCFMALKNAGLNIGIVSSLIQAGCMSGYETYEGKDGTKFTSRSRLVLEAQLFNLFTEKEKPLIATVGPRPEVKWDVIAALKFVSMQNNEKGKPLIKPSRMETLRKKYAPYAEIFKQNSKNERLANFFYERHVLGFSYSETISDIFKEKVDDLITVSEIKDKEPNFRGKIIGFVKEPYKGKTKKGNDEFRFTLTDETGEIRIKTFNEKIKSIENQNGRLPEEEDLVICNVTKMEGDTCFTREGIDGGIIGIQTANVYTKLSELKDVRKDAEKEAGMVEKA